MQKILTVKELPEQERPYEKCLQSGTGSLSDAELISIIIRTGTIGERSTELAERVLNAGPDGLLNLIHLEMDDLLKIRGIGTVKAIQLKCAGELARRITSQSRKNNVILKDAQSIASFYMEKLRHEKKEQLILVMFDTKGMMLRDEVLTTGTSRSSLISSSDIFRTALKFQAEYIVILHNHPSGNPEPSSDDIHVTETIRECGKLMDIPLMDHIIIGDNCYFSFFEEGIMQRKGE